MTELDQVIAAAYESGGKQEQVNKVYITLLRSSLFLPVKNQEASQEEEPFAPLFAVVDGQYYIAAFDTLERLETWAGDAIEQIKYVEITGKDLIAGMNESVYLALNVGAETYKEFPPDEVKHLKKIVARIEGLKN